MATELKQLPTGIQTFEKIREGNYLYVDKTALIYQIAHGNNYIFMSRPRRFGKSLLCSTLKSYFEGRRDLFEGLAMEHLETEWRKHPVLLISLASVPYAENANSEGYYQTMLYVVFSALGLYVQQEVRTAKGRIDMVLHMPDDLYVIVLKIDRPAQEALDQINQKGYLVPYSLDNRRLHKLGISFSTETRTLSEWVIEG